MYRWCWVGAVTDDGFTVAARAGAGEAMRLVVSLSADLSTPTYTAPVTADTDGFAKLAVTGLDPATQYHYAVEVAGVNGSAGMCRTLPTVGTAASFTIATWSCTGVNSSATNSSANPPALAAILADDPDLAVCTGDLHYYNPVPNTASEHHKGYEHVFESNPRYNELLRKVPSIFMWSDHDYCGGDFDGNGNSDKTETGRPAACTAYRKIVPHYPLVRADGLDPDGAIYHKTKIGRVHVIVSDLRSCRDPNDTPHSSSKSMMGATQKAWWKQAMLDAKADGSPIIFWIQETMFDRPRVAVPANDAISDGWGSFDDERVELANYLRDNEIPPLVSLQGDIHMAGGRIRAADYSSNGQGPRMMECHASLMEHAVPLSTGSGWDIGPFTDVGGYYGLVEVTDDGADVTVDYTVYRVDKTTLVKTVEGSISRTFRPSTPPAGPDWLSVLPNGGNGARLRWADVDDPAVVAYRVYRDGALVAQVNADTTSYTAV